MSTVLAETKLLVVVGATGNQGEPILRHFLESNDRFAFKLRGLTRNVRSEPSQKLSKLGVDMFEADLNDERSLSRAFSGATHIFANTDSNQMIYQAIEHPNLLRPDQTPRSYAEEIELAQGRNLANAAACCMTLERLVWSTLPSPKKWSKGKYTKVSMFDAKEAIADILKATPEVLDKLSLLTVGFYASNALKAPRLYAPQKVMYAFSSTSAIPLTVRLQQADGTFELSMAMSADVAVPIADLDNDMGP